MLIWAIFAAMAALAVAAVLRPLVVGREAMTGRARHAEAVYRDQLDELEREVERGLIDPSEADGARAEIARRLITVGDDSGETAVPRPAAAWRRTTAALVIAGVPLLSLGFYLGLGSPDQPASPFAERSQGSFDQQSLPELIARVERHLQENPDDAEGWEIVAPVYMRMRRFSDAAVAWRHAMALGGESAGRLAGFAEALVLAADGIVEADARSAFERAIGLNPNLVQPRYYLGLAAAQDRDFEGAIDIWQRLVDEAPADAPWRANLERQIAMTRAQVASGAAAAPGPSDEEVAASAEMEESERRQMIEGMVARLAERLEAEGHDLDGWLRLVRSYVVLQRPEDARKALARAREIFADEAGALERLDGASDALGL